ncbi:MAG: patatin-like phospholipase family protein [Bacteroidota bacterium]
MSIGIVFSGGGVRGAAHIGVIKALEEYDIFPTHISGTSAGAIVGAFYANGINWDDILEFFKATPLFHIKNYAQGKPGFIDTEKLYKAFIKFFPEDNFDALKKALFVTATDVVKGTLKFFSAGELIRPVLASACFPGVFTPMKIDGSFYIDGGVLNNFPIEPLKMHCDKVIGSYVSPLKNITVHELKHSYTVMYRAHKIREAHEAVHKFSYCDALIFPQTLENYGTFDMKSIDEIFDLGYNEAKKILSGFKRQLLKE